MQDVTGRVVHSAVQPTGSFKCSNDLINKIQQCAEWTEADNLMGIPTDCPQRDERLGWLNDATVRAEEAVYNYHMARLFSKWENDISDTQGEDTGAIADTAPYHKYGRRPADPVCSSYLLIPWLVYLHYGDIRILEEHYLGMKRWVEYLGNNAENYIVNYSSYGDWASPLTQAVGGSLGTSAISAITPGMLMSTGYYYYNSVIMSKVADILGKEKDKKEFIKLKETIREAFNNKFFNKDTNQYALGSQASNVFPLYLGIVPEESKTSVVNNIVRDVMETNQVHLTTGNLCSRYIMDVLTEAGRVDVAYALATQTTYPSWGYMIANGATTIWERWEYVTSGPMCGMASHNHPMYASISAWFYKMLAGITVSEDGPGFENIIIKPYMPDDLNYVNCYVKTVRGTVLANWSKTVNSINMEVSIPFNSSAKVFFPKGDDCCDSTVIREGETIVWGKGNMVYAVDGIKSIHDSGEHIIFAIGSGSYCFTRSKK